MANEAEMLEGLANDFFCLWMRHQPTQNIPGYQARTLESKHVDDSQAGLIWRNVANSYGFRAIPHGFRDYIIGFDQGQTILELRGEQGRDFNLTIMSIHSVELLEPTMWSLLR